MTQRTRLKCEITMQRLVILVWTVLGLVVAFWPGGQFSQAYLSHPARGLRAPSSSSPRLQLLTVTGPQDSQLRLRLSKPQRPLTLTGTAGENRYRLKPTKGSSGPLCSVGNLDDASESRSCAAHNNDRGGQPHKSVLSTSIQKIIQLVVGKNRFQAIWKKGKSKLATAMLVLAMLGGTILNKRPAYASTPATASSAVAVNKNNKRKSAGASTSLEIELTGKGADKTAVVANGNVKANSLHDDALVREVEEEVGRSWRDLAKSLHGTKMDTLILLIVTSVVIPLCKKLKLSPIVGFLFSGMALGRTGLRWVQDEHLVHIIGELGIVFFLFEMGLELSLEKLKSMRKDVFGLGTSQFLVTSALFALAGKLAFGLSPATAIMIGSSLALSSSAFVLQLLRDKEAMGSRVGRASFGILLLQDLAVVPLLVVVDILSKGGAGLGRALTIAGVKAAVTLSTMSFVGKRVLDPVFYHVAKSSSQEAFLSIILSTVLLMSFITEGIGLSNTLGAFLAGLLLSETRYHYQIESDIAPFRGMLLGVFFMTVGFSIDLRLLVSDTPQILGMLLAMLGTKAAVITGLCKAFGMSLSNAQQCGLLNSQVGEFAFVALGIMEKAGIISDALCTRLLTTVALSMCVTPVMFELGTAISNKLESELGAPHYFGLDSDAKAVKSDIESNDFVFICGYGRVGKMVADMLDRKFLRYVALDKNPSRAVDARNKGLPVFYGDGTRADILKSFDVGNARACVVAVDDIKAANTAVEQIVKQYPNLPVFVRAKNAQHQKRLQRVSSNVIALSPVLAEDAVLLTLPFGGVVLEQLGVSKPEIDAILDDFRKTYLNEQNLADESLDFLSSYGRRLPSEEDSEPDDDWSLLGGTSSKGGEGLKASGSLSNGSSSITADDSVAEKKSDSQDDDDNESDIVSVLEKLADAPLEVIEDIMTEDIDRRDPLSALASGP